MTIKSEISHIFDFCAIFVNADAWMLRFENIVSINYRTCKEKREGILRRSLNGGEVLV